MKLKSKFIKQFLSIFLCLIMIFNCLPLAGIITHAAQGPFSGFEKYGIKITSVYMADHYRYTSLVSHTIYAENHVYSGCTLNIAVAGEPTNGKVTVNYAVSYNCDEKGAVSKEGSFILDCSCTTKYSYGKTSPKIDFGDDGVLSIHMEKSVGSHSWQYKCNYNNTHTATCNVCKSTFTEKCGGDSEANCMQSGTCTSCGGSYKDSSLHIWQYSASDNVITASCSCNKISNQTATLSASSDTYSYTGKEIKPLTVSYSENWPGEKPDNQDILYTNNTDVGTASGSITVNGQTATKTFKIEAADISDATVIFNPENSIYNGGEQKPDVSVRWHDISLVEGVDYTLSWDKSGFVNADAYTATITGMGNFEGAKRAEFNIGTVDIKDAVVTLDRNTFVYDGTEHKPEVTVTFKGATLQEGTDYKVTYLLPMKMNQGKPVKWFGTGDISASCINANDKYYAVVEGIGNYYTADKFTLYAPFVIKKATVSEPYIANKPYNGSTQTADISDTDIYTVVENNGGTDRASYDVVLTLKDENNYKWSTVDDKSVTLKFEITKAINEWTFSPAISGWTYGDNANVPNAAAEFGTVKVVYSGKSNDEMDYNSETAPTKAGNYTATFTVAETDNYSGLTEQVNFIVARKTVDLSGVKWNYSKAFKYDGKSHSVSVDETTLPEGASVSNYTGNTGIYVDSYSAVAEIGYDGNHKGNSTVLLNWEIRNDWIPAEYTVSTLNSHGWLNEDFVITAANGYKVSVTNTADGTWSDSLTYNSETADGSVTFYLKNDADGTISLGKTIGYKLDKTPATGKVEYKERSSWEEFVNTITFGLFYKDEVTVVAEASDILSGIEKIEYISSDEAMTLEQVKTITDWTEYTDSFGVALEDAKKFVYFIRITDKAGNATYLSTDGAEYDTAAPVISGVESQETYYTTQKVTVTDRNIDAVTLNDSSATEVITLEGNQDAIYTIVAKDKAGNETTVTVTMKPIEAISAPIDGMDEENVTSADKGTVQDVLDNVKELLKEENLTDSEKTALEEIRSKAENLIKKIEAAAKENNTGNTECPRTGDNSNIWLWIALAIISGVCLLGIILSDCKRKATGKNKEKLNISKENRRTM